MNSKRKIVGPVLAVAAVGVALAVSLFLHRFIEPPPPIAFHATQSASASIGAAGFHCTADNPHGRIDNGFLVSPNAITWQDVNTIRKGTFIAEDWKGKAWVAKSANSGRNYSPSP